MPSFGDEARLVKMSVRMEMKMGSAQCPVNVAAAALQESEGTFVVVLPDF